VAQSRWLCTLHFFFFEKKTSESINRGYNAGWGAMAALYQPAAGAWRIIEDPCLRIAFRVLQGFPGVTMDTSAACGGCRGLFATRGYQPGERILCEEAVVWQLEGDGSFWFNPQAHPEAHIATLVNEFAPWHGAAPPTSLALDVLLYEAMRANSWGCAGLGASSSSPSSSSPSSRGLFPVICLSNNSCAANATAEEVGQGEAGAPVYGLSARRKIDAGEEIFVSYVPRAWKKAARARELRAAWGVACTCERCAAVFDDTQCARCRACKDGRLFLPDNAEQWSSAPCADCGAPGDASALAAADENGVSGGGVGGGGPLLADAEGMGLEELREAARAALGHPVLAVDDARIITWLNSGLRRAVELLGQAQEEEEEEEGGGEGGGSTAQGPLTELQQVYEELLGGLVRVCSRSGFASLADLGIEVEEE
jgi:hypothetical protein